LKSPLRYPGGKSRAIPQILPYLPAQFDEYREPFVGGGALFVYLKQKYPTLKTWINDLNLELYFFWKYTQRDADKLAKALRQIKQERADGRALFEELMAVDVKQLSEFERAVRFFVLNRISFSGTVESGGFSQAAFESRLTLSAIERLAAIGPLLKGVHITQLDYRDVLLVSSKNVFIFLDPPYLKATKSRLYGKHGTLHTTFNHTEFACAMQACKHPWLITYDDSPDIRRNFAFAHSYEWELQYGMNNYKQGKADKGQELFLTNYAVPHVPHNQLALLEHKSRYKNGRS
jgi:DNA adenine methylase